MRPAAWLVCALMTGGCAQSRIGVEIVQVTGFSDEGSSVWMPMRVTLDLANLGRDTAVTAVQVEPDFEGFNEAYGVGVPHNLDTPLQIATGGTARYEAVVTLLNAQQLQPGMHDLTFKVRLETTDNREISVEIAARFQQATQPTERILTLDGDLATNR
jgi:hypothetical protein